MRRIILIALILYASPLAAQQDSTWVPTGVRIGMIYEPLRRPIVAVRPFAAIGEVARIADQVGPIVRRDLDYSDRFEMFDTPPQLTSGPVDYEAWNGLNVMYVLEGAVEPLTDGYLLRLTLHDVVYGRVSELEAFRLPEASSAGFRLAVHAAADRVVEWLTGQPGMAASRITFFRENGDGTRDLMVVDADGENLRRVARVEGYLMSPAWAPDGRRIAYTVGSEDGSWEVFEQDLETDRRRTVTPRPGLNMTPAYSPDGRRLALAVSSGRNAEDLFEIDLETGRARELRTGPGIDISPSYSPDGRQLAFISDRIGQPHVYVMPSDGGEAILLSPYTYGESGAYHAPDWSPETSYVAFHGQSRGTFHIMVANAADPDETVRQLTREGRSQNPSWAPDGRHLVFEGVRAEGTGLYVMDAVSGRTRPLVLGGRVRMPDWSPALMRASALTVRDE